MLETAWSARAGAGIRSDADTGADGVVEIMGVIKWFDASKGYGFIVPDNGLPDVLLHVTCLRRHGYKTVYEGARVTCEASRTIRGLQCSRILSMDSTGAIDSPESSPHAEAAVTLASGFKKAKVKWFSRLRGFGFLTRGEGTPDIFIHAEVLRHCRVVELQPDQRVTVRFNEGSKGPYATELRVM